MQAFKPMTGHAAWIAAAAALVWVAALAFPGVELSAEDTPRLSEICLDCHEQHQSLGTPHQILEEFLDEPGAPIACTDCHNGDEGHWDDDPEEYPMTNPADMSVSDMAGLCSSCHMNSHQQTMFEKNIHAVSEINCSGCHEVHSNTRLGLLKDEQTELCYGCHGGTRGEFARPFRHPVEDGIVKCTECHQTLDETGTELSFNGTNVCFDCHAEFQGPYLFEHEATFDYSTQEGGCLTCHDPHGSFTARMLTQSYDSPFSNVCSQCHVVPGHMMNAQHGDAFADRACGECHSDIHGSYTNRNYLDPSLRAGCSNSGICHQI